VLSNTRYRDTVLGTMLDGRNGEIPRAEPVL